MGQTENTTGIILDFFQKYGILRRFTPGTQLFMKDSPADTIYYLLKGKVRAYFLYPDGTEHTLCYVEQGNLVGEEVASDPPIRIVCCDVTAESRMYAISRENLMKVLPGEPEAMNALLGFYMKKITVLCDWIYYAHFRQNRAKLASFLYTNSAAGMEVQYTQQQIAEVTGMSRVSVSNCLQELAERGLAEPGYRKIIVHDRDGLAGLFAGETVSE